MIEKNKHCRIPSFYLLKPMNLKWDRFYKVYIKSDVLFGAKLAGQIFDEESGYIIFSNTVLLGLLLELLLSPWIKKKIERRYELEKQYDAYEFGVTDFLSKDEANFVINKCDMKKVKITTRRRFWTAAYTNKGTLIIETNQNETMKFIIIGRQKIKYIEAIFSNLGIPVEIKYNDFCSLFFKKPSC